MCARVQIERILCIHSGILMYAERTPPSVKYSILSLARSKSQKNFVKSLCVRNRKISIISDGINIVSRFNKIQQLCTRNATRLPAGGSATPIVRCSLHCECDYHLSLTVSP